MCASELLRVLNSLGNVFGGDRGGTRGKLTLAWSDTNGLSSEPSLPLSLFTLLRVLPRFGWFPA